MSIFKSLTIGLLALCALALASDTNASAHARRYVGTFLCRGAHETCVQGRKGASIVLRANGGNETFRANGKTGDVTIAGVLSANAVIVKTPFITPQPTATPAIPYKSYLARLKQTGTNEPTVTVISSNLGAEIAWARVAVGSFIGQLSDGQFDANRTVVIPSMFSNQASYYISIPSGGPYRGMIQFSTNNGGGDADGYLDTFLEIRVYP